MKSTLNQIKHFTFSLLLVVTSSSLPINTFAETDTTLDQQKKDCAANSSWEWNSAQNKCVQKKTDQTNRNEAERCAQIKDMAQREACNKALAEKMSGLSANTGTLYQGNKDDAGMLMNTAYTIIAMINTGSMNLLNETCTSKKIFGLTAAVGVASDFYLKHQAKKKVDELNGKYKLEVADTASNAQVKAFQFLKDEQNTVADIASQEKTRNMLLMLGYGAAAVMAIVDIAGSTTGTTSACFKNSTAGTNGGAGGAGSAESGLPTGKPVIGLPN